MGENFSHFRWNRWIYTPCRLHAVQYIGVYLSTMNLFVSQLVVTAANWTKNGENCNILMRRIHKTIYYVNYGHPRHSQANDCSCIYGKKFELSCTLFSLELDCFVVNLSLFSSDCATKCNANIRKMRVQMMIMFIVIFILFLYEWQFNGTCA